MPADLLPCPIAVVADIDTEIFVSAIHPDHREYAATIVAKRQRLPSLPDLRHYLWFWPLSARLAVSVHASDSALSLAGQTADPAGFLYPVVDRVYADQRVETYSAEILIDPDPCCFRPAAPVCFSFARPCFFFLIFSAALIFFL